MTDVILHGTKQFDLSDEIEKDDYARSRRGHDLCPRCGENPKRKESGLCLQCSIERRSVVMEAKFMVKRLLSGEKFVIFFTDGEITDGTELLV
jgi:hypothetical protein